MTPTMGALDFFLLESGDYLQRMEVMAQNPAGELPGADEFVRLARAFRGSAVMASQHGMERAAKGFESIGKSLHEGRLQWNDATRLEVIRSLDDCIVLMRRLRSPEAGDVERAQQIGQRLERLSGRPSVEIRAASGLDSGGRAFVAREASAIARALQQASRRLSQDPADVDAVTPLAPAMSTLRGVAVLNDLPPLADVLAAVDGAARSVRVRPGEVGLGAAGVFEAGSLALARAAREVVDAGRPQSATPELNAFASSVLEVFIPGSEVVPIEQLFFDDEGPHVVEAHVPPAPPVLARVELVSQGEFLAAAVGELERATSSVQRNLRLFGIAASLRPMLGAGGSPLSTAVGRFAEAARDAIGRGAAAASLELFVKGVRGAADALSGARQGDEDRIAAGIDAAAAELRGLGTARAEAPAAKPVAEAAPEPVRDVAAEPAPAAPPQPRAVRGPADLATSYLTLEALISERGLPLGSLDELLSGGTTAPAEAEPEQVVPIESLAPDEEEGVMAVEELLYGGERALRRALELQSQLTGTVTAPADALLEEVFDLIRLGIGPGR